MRYLIVFLCLLPLSSQASINVVTSIEPLYLITKSIMRGVAEPELLIKPSASVHDFAFKPSQMRLLKKADLVILIDRNFESGFQKLPAIISRDTEIIELLLKNNADPNIPPIDLNSIFHSNLPIYFTLLTHIYRYSSSTRITPSFTRTCARSSPRASTTTPTQWA